MLLKYSENSSSLKEANEICKLMGKRIKFKQCIIQLMVDETRNRQYDESSSEDDMIFAEPKK
jgi:hypothetical protein